VVHPERSPITRSPAELNIAFEDVALTSADSLVELAGWWMPAPEPRASLVFIHGASSNRHSRFFGSLGFYQTMVNNAVSVLAIDLRNHGASGNDPRGLQFGRTEQFDAMAAIAWLRQRQPGLPLFAMGKSMGGAALIYATASGVETDGLILMDPLLDVHSGITSGIYAETGWPPGLFCPSAWVAARFYGLPSGDNEPLAVAEALQQRTLLIQDPEDPVTHAVHARQLASSNPDISLWEVPPVAPDHPKLVGRRQWGTHVAGFVLFPEAVLQQLLSFMGL